MPTQMLLVERVFRSFWAPFGALHPLGDFPQKCPLGGFFLYVSWWELFAIPHTYILSFGLSWLLRFTCCSSLCRLWPSCSLVFVLFVSLLFFWCYCSSDEKNERRTIPATKLHNFPGRKKKALRTARSD